MRYEFVVSGAIHGDGAEGQQSTGEDAQDRDEPKAVADLGDEPSHHVSQRRHPLTATAFRGAGRKEVRAFMDGCFRRLPMPPRSTPLPPTTDDSQSRSGIGAHTA